MNIYTYFSYGMAIAIVTGAPIALAFLVHRRLSVPWTYLAYGILAFIFSEILRIPMLKIIKMFAVGQQDSASLLWMVSLASTAGIFEEVARYVGLSYFFHNGRNPRNAVMYGLGHGGFEAFLVAIQMAFGLYILLSYRRLDTSAIQFNPQNLADIALAKTWWLPMAGALMRIFALPVHIALSLTVLQAFLRQDRFWLPAAICIHTVINLTAMLTWKRLGLFCAEILMGLFAISAILWAKKLFSIDIMAQTQ
ncbi:MAG: YhfC family glutamic-type intramembrane protease [Armatimonadota bacterium]|nr:YhfC family glutamic-type intramembrane protease [Armatimonadota bacterium]